MLNTHQFLLYTVHCHSYRYERLHLQITRPSLGLITNKKIKAGWISGHTYILTVFQHGSSTDKGVYRVIFHTGTNSEGKKALQNQNLWNKRDLIPCTHTHTILCQQLLFPHCIFVHNENSTVSAETYQPCKILTVINTCANERLVSYILH